MFKSLLIFLILNFAALAIGGMFTGKGVPSEWYANLNKAPWTPPGWVFGFAWTTIMVCFSFYMSFMLKEANGSKMLLILFALQWILNVSWNPTFFYFHNSFAGLLIISGLLLIVLLLFIFYVPLLKVKSLLILPYIIWLGIATSLNAYIFVKN